MNFQGREVDQGGNVANIECGVLNRELLLVLHESGRMA